MKNSPTAAFISPQNIFLWLLLALLLFFALTLGVGALIHLSATACDTDSSSFWDVWRAQNFGSNVFDPQVWQKSYTVQPGRIQVVWDAPSLGSIATLDYLLYNCGWKEADLDAYYSDQNFTDIIFADYQNVKKTAACRAGENRLYQFDAQFEGTDYRLWQWVLPSGSRRVFGLVMVIPAQDFSAGLQDAQKLVPQLPQCP